jgi:hypothetical protein
MPEKCQWRKGARENLPEPGGDPCKLVIVNPYDAVMVVLHNSTDFFRKPPVDGVVAVKAFGMFQDPPRFLMEQGPEKIVDKALIGLFLGGILKGTPKGNPVPSDLKKKTVKGLADASGGIAEFRTGRGS